MGRPRKPQPSLRLFTRRLTIAEAKAVLERLGGIDRRARVVEETSGVKDARGRPYTKWRARYGKSVWSLRREDVADAQQALSVLAEDAEEQLARLTPEQREALGLKKTEATAPIKVYANDRPPK